MKNLAKMTHHSISFSGLLSAGAMGFWHGVEYYEKERVVGDEFYQQWNSVSKSFKYNIMQSDSPSMMHTSFLVFKI